MNLLLVLANVIGFLALGAACLKIIETGPTIGPAFSPAARVVILSIVFLAVCSALEAMSWRREMRPSASVLVFILGLFSVWRAWAPAWASFFTRNSFWSFPHRIAPPKV